MRLIDADEFRKTMLAEIERLYRVGHLYSATVVSDVIEKLEQCPTVESEPVIHAHWIIEENGLYAKCSNCGTTDYSEEYSIDEKFYNEENKYCCNCGAKMDE